MGHTEVYNYPGWPDPRPVDRVVTAGFEPLDVSAFSVLFYLVASDRSPGPPALVVAVANIEVETGVVELTYAISIRLATEGPPVGIWEVITTTPTRETIS